MEKDSLEHMIQHRDALLVEMRRRQTVVRDYTRGVARGYSTGLYLFGRPGTAKTHTVREVLEREIKESYCYQRGHLTPMGLFELIGEHRDEVIVLDDLAAVLDSDVALQVLLSALEKPDTHDRGRTVKYKRQGHEEQVYFRGGIVCISNRELHDDELLSAFKSRVHTLNYNPSDAQVGALMLDIASRGWSLNPGTISGGQVDVTPEQATQVAHHVISEMLRLNLRFDLRVLVCKALPDYQQWQDGEAESDWRDLVTASLEQQLVALRHPSQDGSPSGRDARKQDEHAIVRAILAEQESREGRVSEWTRRTGKSQRAFYRRLAEMRD